MARLLTYKLLTFAPWQSRRSCDTRKPSLPKTICLILAFCTATAIASPTQTFTTLLSFDGTDGANPQAGLVQGPNGNFYGTTSYDGTSGGGTVFEITPTGTLTTLYNFCSQPSCSDGAGPGGLTLATNGNFYGVAGSGGTTGNGTIFEISPAGQLTTLYTFCPQQCFSDRPFPEGTLVQGRNGNLYGMASNGGTNDGGYLFEITPAGKFTALYNFCAPSGCSDGSGPTGLVQASNGNIYGTTFGNTDYNSCVRTATCGTVFEMTPAGKLTTTYAFCTQIDCTDGEGPSALIQARNGTFYGVTYAGVFNPGCPPNLGCGTIFEITPGGKFTTVYTFCSLANCADGTNAFSLVQATDGNFYGTADSFSGNAGSIFELTPGGQLTTLYNFCSQNDCAGGEEPVTGILQSTDGVLYGTTRAGGTNDDGVVYSLSQGLRPFVMTTPTSGKVGAKVIILGNDLKGATRVAFDGTDATITSDSNSEITTTVPTGATTGTVEVMTAAGRKLESDVVFQVTP